MDVLTPQQRSSNMAAIKGKDTRPERVVRSLVHAIGYRYRLHRKDLPGKPDLVFPRLKKIILVHGCFWHVHDCKYGRVKPADNAAFWEAKRCGTTERDRKNVAALQLLGWDIFIVWECWTRNHITLQSRLIGFLADSGPKI